MTATEINKPNGAAAHRAIYKISVIAGFSG
jgi:hypothetical protein